jgi:hypothetical protein
MAWFNGTMWHELHAREDGRSRREPSSCRVSWALRSRRRQTFPGRRQQTRLAPGSCINRVAMSDSTVSHPDDLYTLPLDDFTGARERLAERLRADGEDDRAASVAKLRKPSVAAWALNLAARERPDLVERLVASHRKLRQATSAELLQEASRDRQEAIAELTELSLAQLIAAGRPTTPTTRDRINSTLLAVATDGEAEKDLAASRLVRELEPTGGGWGEIGLEPPSTKDPKSRERAAAERARSRAEKLEAEAGKAAKRLQQAERALDEAKRRVRETRAAADQAESEAREAEKASAEPGAGQSQL